MAPIYTRRGDKGETSLADGTRIPKSAIRVEAYGTVDEANAHVGRVRSILARDAGDAVLDDVLHFIQQRLYNCSSSLAMPVDHVEPRTPHLADEDIAALERGIDVFIERAGTIDHFVLPAGGELACALHVARTTMRRAERATVALMVEEPIDELVLRFLNRSSDLLFAAARYAGSLEGDADEFWDPEAPRPGI